MKTLAEVHAEIERTSERRAELWQALSEGHDTNLAAELKELEQRLATLWDEHRMLKAQARFGDRDEIIRRARHEERLARAA
jgi:ABC-type phosphate transport system auxiliary subunit